MAARLTARDVVRIALEVEQTGKSSYVEMRQATDDPEMLRLLDYLAGEEKSEDRPMIQRLIREEEQHVWDIQQLLNQRLVRPDGKIKL